MPKNWCLSNTGALTVLDLVVVLLAFYIRIKLNFLINQNYLPYFSYNFINLYIITPLRMGSTSQEKEDASLAELSDIRFNPPLYEQRYQDVARIARECQPKKVICLVSPDQCSCSELLKRP